jgi:hypothetical protein
VLIVLVSGGLPSERVEPATSAAPATLQPVRFVFSRASVLLALACVLLVAILITIAGVGVGMRKSEVAVTRPHAVGLQTHGYHPV